jgi:hypothetical protein
MTKIFSATTLRQQLKTYSLIESCGTQIGGKLSPKVLTLLHAKSGVEPRILVKLEETRTISLRQQLKTHSLRFEYKQKTSY